MYATLQATLSVGPSVGRSVCLSLKARSKQLIFVDGVDFFANLLYLQSTIFKFSFFIILSNFYANLSYSPIFKIKFNIRIVWSMFESDMTKALDVTELLRQSLQQILAT